MDGEPLRLLVAGQGTHYWSSAGRRASFNPVGGLPVCAARSGGGKGAECRVSCEGVASAYNRARQWRYDKVADAALRVGERLGCEWATGVAHAAVAAVAALGVIAVAVVAAPVSAMLAKAAGGRHMRKVAFQSGPPNALLKVWKIPHRVDAVSDAYDDDLECDTITTPLV